MSEHTGLIERLRNYRGGYDHEHDCHGAANVIEQLEAALRESNQTMQKVIDALEMQPFNSLPFNRRNLSKQISANEAVLGGGK